MSGDLVLVADVHLGRNDPDLEAFVAFVEERRRDTAVLVLLGDIFSLWLGRAKFTQPHHRRVLDACAALRASGVRVVFIEGNREFAAASWQGSAFDHVAEDMTAEPWAGKRWYLAHGDLLNREDRRGRAFRAVIRSAPVLAAFGALPPATGMRLAARLERALRHRNMRHKTAIPGARFERYASWLADRGFDAGVIGHIHVERALELDAGDGRTRALYVLPDWRTARRYLRVPREGSPRFTSWGPPRPDPPSIVRVDERARELVIELDSLKPPAPETPVAVTGGHGPEVRRGRVTRIDENAPATIVVELEPGPPARVGDRVLGLTRREP